MHLMGQIEAAVSDMRVGQRGVVLFSMMKEPARVEASHQMYLSNAEYNEKLIAELKPLLVTERAKRAMEILITSLAAWRPRYQEVRDFSAKQQFDGELKRALDQGVAQSEQMSKAANDIIQAQNDLFAISTEKAKAQTASSRWIAFVLIGICLAVGAGVVWIVRQISNTLRQIATEMADGADQVSAAAGQVSSSSQSLAQGASEQAASIEETSASSEEINSMSRKNAENSKVAAENMEDASVRVGEANRNLEQMVVSMNEINASSDKISKIIKVIDEIAFQTNILALNAAVEAARAGEAGMGFAVVADEVRNLAQRCAQAAKDTAGLIEESIAKSKDGKSKLDQVAAAVNSITESAGKVKTLVDEVKVGSEEQTRGIEQVSKAITQMEKVTQTTAANAEESASASEELSAQSDTLRSVVARLNGMVGGGQAA
jgi:methyl-accepting chemotaxis protein/methyl-accepting chemotaxis protein-1 (serine sensor receptor)